MGVFMELFLISIVGVISTCYGQDFCRSYEEATANLREVVISSCTIYQLSINQPAFCPDDFRNCTAVWEAFSGAFRNQPKCNVSDERYTDYINLTHHTVLKDKAIFWENVYPFVHRFSNEGRRYMALSDTLPGYIGNVGQWCGMVEDPGISPPRTLCPGWQATPDCPQSAQRAFWIAMSRNFGQSAAGDITIMLNASVTPIYSTDSYMSVYEMPNLRRNIVTKATVLLLNEHSKSDSSKCDEGSLKALRQLLEAKDIQYECVENRRDVVMMYCLDNPGADFCSLLDNNGGTSAAVDVITHANTLLLLLLVVFKSLLFFS